MKKTLLLNGVGGSNASPPETKPQSAAETLPPVLAEQPAPVTADSDALVKKRVAKAKREFERQAVALIKNEESGFFLKLCITMTFIWLKVGDKDSYVDETLAKLNEKYTEVWVPAKTTLQHYEGPMLGWLTKLARQKNPDDHNLPHKFSMSFLRENPHYLLDASDADLKTLHNDCKTLVKFDQIHGNGRVKKEVLQIELTAKAIAPVALTRMAEEIATNPHKKIRGGAKDEVPAQAIEPAVKATPTEDTVTQSPKKKAGGTQHQLAQRAIVQGRTHQSSSAEVMESALPSNDDLLERIHEMEQNMLAMKEAGVPIKRDVILAMLQCYMTAKKINEYFSPRPFTLTA